MQGVRVIQLQQQSGGWRTSLALVLGDRFFCAVPSTPQNLKKPNESCNTFLYIFLLRNIRSSGAIPQLALTSVGECLSLIPKP